MLEAASISGEGEEETPRMESDSWRKGEEECRDLEVLTVQQLEKGSHSGPGKYGSASGGSWGSWSWL